MRLSLDPLESTQRLTAHPAQVRTHTRMRMMATADTRRCRNQVRGFSEGIDCGRKSALADSCAVTGVSNRRALAGLKQNSGTYEPECRLMRNLDSVPVLP